MHKEATKVEQNDKCHYDVCPAEHIECVDECKGSKLQGSAHKLLLLRVTSLAVLCSARALGKVVNGT